MTSAMKKSTFATVLAVEATPLKPKIPAMIEIIKNIRAHLSISPPPKIKKTK